MRIVLLYIFLVLSIAVGAQEQSHISISIPDYSEDFVVLGNYYGDRTLVYDTIYANNQGIYEAKADSLMPLGMYLVVLEPTGKFVQFLVEEDQIFSMSIDTAGIPKIKFEGSEGNEQFSRYMAFLENENEKVSVIDNTLADTTMFMGIKDKLASERELIDVEVKSYQEEYIRKHPRTLGSSIIKAGKPTDFPLFQGDEQQQQMQQYFYYKDHYFDNIDLGDPRLLRTSFFNNRIEYYLDKLVSPVPDSLIVAVDYLLSQMSPAPKTYQYYLSTFLSKYGNSKIVGQDGVYVHLALNYYNKGKAPWVPEKNLKKIVFEAQKIEPTLIGKAASDFTLFMEDNTPVALKDIEEDYVVLFFWKPGCAHCTQAVPFLKDFDKKYKTQNVKTLAVCNGVGKKYDKCWEAVVEKGMEELINLGDQYQKSRILSNYYINVTPKIFILDKERKIVMKGIGAKQLDNVMQNLIRLQEK